MSGHPESVETPEETGGGRESAERRRLVARLEAEVVELRAAAEAVYSLADQISDAVGCAQARGEPPTAETVPHFGLLWAARTLQTHVDALDAKLNGDNPNGSWTA